MQSVKENLAALALALMSCLYTYETNQAIIGIISDTNKRTKKITLYNLKRPSAMPPSAGQMNAALA